MVRISKCFLLFSSLFFPAHLLGLSSNDLRSCPAAQSLSSSWEPNGWYPSGSKDGFRSFGRDIPGSPLKIIGGDGILDASIEDILRHTNDVSEATKWMDRLTEMRIVEHDHLTHTTVRYTSFALPFPFDTRDFSNSIKPTWRPDLGAVVLEIRNHNHPATKKTKGVRASSKGTVYYFPIDGGKKTYIWMTYEINPSGAMPAWLVNLIQKTWPSNTLSAINQRASSSPAPTNTVIEPFVKTLPASKKCGSASKP